MYTVTQITRRCQAIIEYSIKKVLVQKLDAICQPTTNLPLEKTV